MTGLSFKALMGALVSSLLLLSGSAAAAPLEAPGEQTAALSPDDVAAVRRAIDYLNGIESFEARFLQVSSDGGIAEGDVVVDRPGKLRFDYDPPVPVLIIANGWSLLYYDRELEQASFMPLWETPLWFLIRDEVKLSDDIRVTDVRQDRGVLRITLVNREEADEGRVTLVFSDHPLVLRKWELVDAKGVETQVSLLNPQFGVEVDPELFEHKDLGVGVYRHRDRR